jgi:hypothetical protein
MWFEELVNSGRAGKASYGDGRTAWVATESVPTVAAAFPDVRFEPVQPPCPSRAMDRRRTRPSSFWYEAGSSPRDRRL